VPNYGYHFARFQGRVVQQTYERFLRFIAGRRIQCHHHLPLDVFAYSGQRRLAEQVASIRSFLTNAGRPNRFVVVSDGSHSPESIDLLRRVDDCVAVESVPAPDSKISNPLRAYLRDHSTGKQLALIMSLPRDAPALYVDSDVRFFSSAPDLMNYAGSTTVTAFYLEDCGFAGDQRLLRTEEEKLKPVNTGALLIRRELDWSIGLDRFHHLDGVPNFFTNQTMTHLVMHANKARSFDPSKYVLKLDDQFIYRDWYAGSDIVLRHYVDPVRHKFWTSLIG